MVTGVLESVERIVVRSDKPAVDSVRAALQDYCALQGNALGGCLQRLLYEGDTTLIGVQWCLNTAKNEHDVNGQLLALILMRMTDDEREQLVGVGWSPEI